VLQEVGAAALRGAGTPQPGFWTASQPELRARGPLAAVWARVPGGGTTRATLSEIGGRGAPPPAVPLQALSGQAEEEEAQAA
jgi:hypothetical protein